MSAIDSFTGNHEFLSNFFEFGSKPTVEHIFQSMKTTDMAEQIWVLSAPTPGTAKRRGRKVTMRPDWNDIRLDVMEMCLRQKFADPFLANALLSTGTAELIEGNHWNDTFWGVCNGKGENHLGKLLMKIRKELQDDPS